MVEGRGEGRGGVETRDVSKGDIHASRHAGDKEKNKDKGQRQRLRTKTRTKDKDKDKALRTKTKTTQRGGGGGGVMQHLPKRLSIDVKTVSVAVSSRQNGGDQSLEKAFTMFSRRAPHPPQDKTKQINDKDKANKGNNDFNTQLETTETKTIQGKTNPPFQTIKPCTNACTCVRICITLIVLVLELGLE